MANVPGIPGISYAQYRGGWKLRWRETHATPSGPEVRARSCMVDKESDVPERAVEIRRALDRQGWWEPGSAAAPVLAKPMEVELKAGPVRPRDAERASVPEAGLLLRQATFFDIVEAGLPAPTGAAPGGALVGAIVLDLEPDGAAARAGLKTGDLVLKREGEPVTSLRDLRERLAAPGTQALTVRRRGGEELTLRVRR